MNYRRLKRPAAVGRYARSIIENFNHMFSFLDANVQRRLVENRSEVQPVFVVGLPRSGTTLLYQLLLNHFDWIYLSRSMDFLYRLPVTTYKMQQMLLPEPKGFEYRSEYGTFDFHDLLAKPWSPSEGHPVWQRWFSEKPTHYHEGDLSPAAIDEMRSMIAGFVAVSGKPFLNKNPRHSMRLQLLSNAFPKALFVVLKRESLYVAQSLYVARIRERPRPNPNDDWWGTRPKEYMQLKDADPMTQAVGQTKAIERELSAQLQDFSSRYIEVDYQEMCQNPAQILNDVQATCLELNIPLRRKRHDDPMTFPLKDERKGVSEAEFDQLKKCWK
ncbi:MAG: hypothetical protein ETSY1_07350 [Candidatus Entotheonella factor]|uniref:Sulfotransferase n=1 Tax=Entotheonella factor TaxID=1429438 RepID=W4LU00_ENTF1|nr:MAG: hypothetical protein ETSY1_07350 [Candidatus Entotheonella factor]